LSRIAAAVRLQREQSAVDEIQNAVLVLKNPLKQHCEHLVAGKVGGQRAAQFEE